MLQLSSQPPRLGTLYDTQANKNPDAIKIKIKVKPLQLLKEPNGLKLDKAQPKTAKTRL